VPIVRDHGAEAERRAELGAFLRSRRARIDPKRLGLPVAARRRAPGLLREEVAALAGVSTTWYTYLEQGRAINPSEAVLKSLSDVLVFDDDERRYVHMLVFQTSPHRVQPDAGEAATVASAMVDLHADSPHPFYAGNQYGDVIAWNQAAVRWYTDFESLPPGRRNMLWWMLTDPVARTRIGDWESDTRDVVARLRANYATRSADPQLRAMVEDLAEASPEFRSWWGEQHVADQHPRPRRLRHPQSGERTYNVVVLRNPGDSFTAYVAHLPWDDEHQAQSSTDTSVPGAETGKTSGHHAGSQSSR
jgi:transcriptional regulator with XRE-family HTH domain